MRRTVFIIALCVILIAAPALSASAAETSGNSFNVLDYVSANGTNSNFFSFTGSTAVNYNFESMLGRMRSYWFDIVYVSTSVSCTLESITSGVHTIPVSESQSGTSGNRTVHASGTFGGLALAGFDLNFTNDGSGLSYVTIISFTIHTLDFNRINIPSTISATPGNSAVLSPGSSVTVSSTAFSGVVSQVTFSALISKSYWQDVDYIDFSGSVSCANLVSISAFTTDDVSLPIETCYLSSGVADSDLQRSNYYFTIRVDLTSFDKSSTDGYIRILLSTVSPEGLSNVLTVTGLNGVLVSAPIDAELKWYQILWRDMKDGFNSVIDTLKDLLGTDEEFDEGSKEELGSANQDMSDLASGIKDRTPVVNTEDIGFAVNNAADVTTDLVSGVTPFMNILFDSGDGLIIVLLELVALFALIGYIFFGRK